MSATCEHVERRGLCARCRVKRRRARSRLLAERRKKGVCTRCGESPPTPGLLLCEACRNTPSKKYDQGAAVRAKRIEKGLCSHCGQEPALPGLRWGLKCRTEYAKAGEARDALPGCVVCHAPCRGRLCPTHRDAQNAREPRKTSVRRTCQCCGKPGHFAKTCIEGGPTP